MTQPIISRRLRDLRWCRLRRLIRHLRPGEIVTARGLAQSTGVAPESIELMLDALTRGAMFSRVDRARFRRCGSDVSDSGSWWGARDGILRRNARRQRGDVDRS